MTSSVIRKYALAALCGAAMFGVGQGAQAASTWTIIGGAAPSGTANYDTDPSHNNVISSPLAGNFVNDPLLGATILQAAQLGTTTTGAYNVSWIYVGSESANVIQFVAPGVAPANAGLLPPLVPSVGYAESNANNQCVGCGYNPLLNQPGPLAMGSSLNLAANSNPVFAFIDQDGSNVANGGNPGDNVLLPNFLISYASLIAGKLVLQAAPSDWVVFGFNDTGSKDDNHDDFIVAARITDAGREDGVPIPGALPLFASVLGGGYLFRRLRNRRQAKAAA